MTNWSARAAREAAASDTPSAGEGGGIRGSHRGGGGGGGILAGFWLVCKLYEERLGRAMQSFAAKRADGRLRFRVLVEAHKANAAAQAGRGVHEDTRSDDAPERSK